MGFFSWVADKYNDAVELTAMTIAPAVNYLADGKATPYESERILGDVHKAEAFARQGVPVNATPEQLQQIRDKSKELAAQAEKSVDEHTFTKDIRAVKEGIKQKYNDGVEITAVAIAPIVNPIAEGRPLDAAKYIVNKTPLGVVASPLGAALLYDPKFEVKKEDEYVPEVYQKAEAYYKQGTPEHATQRQLHEASVRGYEVNAEVQKKTADYQDVAVDIMTLPANVITAGASLPVMLAGDVAINEGMHAFVNTALPGDRPGDTLGSRLMNWASPGSVKPSATTLAMQELERARNNPNLAAMFEEEHAQEAAELKRKIYAQYGINPDGTPLNSGNAAAQEHNGTAEPGFFSRIGEILSAMWKSIVGLFKASEPQTAVTNIVVQNTSETPVVPSGIPAKVQNTERGK